MLALNKQTGFTLIEMMIAIAIIGTLAAIGYPSYTTYVLKTQRTEGMANLQKLRGAYEVFYFETGGYPTNNTLPPSPTIPSTDNYSYTSSVNATNLTYTITATGLGSQAEDETPDPNSETPISCKVLTINKEGEVTPPLCWGN